MQQNTSYIFRKSKFEKHQYWELSDNGLLFRQVGKVDMLIPYHLITHIRVLYKPSRFRTANYSCVFTVFGSRKVEIFSTSYKHIGNFSDEGNSYTPFVKELVKRTIGANPSCSIHAGQSWFTYTWHFLLTFLVFAMLFVVFSLIPIVGSTIFIIKMLLIGFYAVYIFKSFYINIPHRIVRGEIPPRVLPSISK